LPSQASGLHGPTGPVVASVVVSVVVSVVELPVPVVGSVVVGSVVLVGPVLVEVVGSSMVSLVVVAPVVTVVVVGSTVVGVDVVLLPVELVSVSAGSCALQLRANAPDNARSRVMREYIPILLSRSGRWSKRPASAPWCRPEVDPRANAGDRARGSQRAVARPGRSA
jgi:hypothetical protein